MSAARFGGKVLIKSATDVVLSRATLFLVSRAKDIVGLPTSTIGVVEERKGCELSRLGVLWGWNRHTKDKGDD